MRDNAEKFRKWCKRYRGYNYTIYTYSILIVINNLDIDELSDMIQHIIMTAACHPGHWLHI